MGVFVSTLTSGSPLNSPCDGSIDSRGQYIYIGQNTGKNVLRVDAATGVATVFAGSGAASSVDGTGTGSSLNQPGNAAIDNNDQYLYVYEITGNRIRKIEVATAVVTTIATAVASSYAVAVVPAPTNDYLYVPASSNNTIIRVKISDGTKNTVAGSGTAGGANGTGTAATFNAPRGCAIDRAGANLYVCDISGHRVRKVALNGGGLNAGTVTTIAGSGTAGSANGVGIAATLNQPLSCCLDTTERYLYVAEFVGKNVRRIDLLSTEVTTLAGLSSAGTVDGNDKIAKFDSPGALYGRQSVLYVNDQATNRVRKIQLTNVQWNNRGVKPAPFKPGPTSVQVR